MKFLENLLRWVVLIGIFALPTIAVIVADSMFFPYITGKNFAFRIIIEIITMAWLALAFAFPKYRPKKSWILVSLTVFVIIIAIADAQGVNPFKSFLSNFERMDGWITIAHLLLFVVVASSMLQTEQLWRRFLAWTLVGSGFLSVIGLLQVANVIDFGSGGTSRIDATFGNPIYLAVFMLFNVFFGLLLWAQEGNERWGALERILIAAVPFFMYVEYAIFAQAAAQFATMSVFFVFTVLSVALFEVLSLAPRKWLIGVIMVLDTIALLLSETRGAALGLVGGLFLALLLYSFSRGGSRVLRQLTVGSLIVLVVAAGGIYFGRNTAVVQHVGILRRLATISVTSGETVARVYNVETAWKGIKERPILGWGQENYAIVFDKFYDPRMYAQEQWFDRVHDIVFDWWIAGGTLGLLAYLSIFAALFWVLWRTGEFDAAERAILTGLLAGYFVQNLTVFDNITSYVLFGLVLGYIIFRDRSKILWGESEGSALALPFTAGAALVAAVVIVWVVNAAPIAENLTLISALQQQPGGAAQNLALFEQAIAYDTIGTQEAREQLSQIAASVVQTSGIPDSLKQQFVSTSVQQLDQQSKVSPLDARFPLFSGSLLDIAGDYQDAWTYLQKAHELSPDKQTILFEMVQNAEDRKDPQTAVSLAKQAYELDTQDQQALLVYASAEIRAGNDAQGQQLWQQYQSQNPTDAQSYFTIASAYYQAGNTAQAIALLKAAEAAVPSVAQQANSLISQLQGAAH